MRIFLIAIICLLCSASVGLAKQDKYFATKDQFMCVTLSDFNKLVSYVRLGDKTSVVVLVINERCFTMIGGDPLRVIGEAGGGVVKVELIPSGEILWTLKASLTP